MASEDIIKLWIGDRCHEDLATTTKSSDLYRSFKEWAETSGERAISQRAFSMALESRGYHKSKTMYGRFFHGLRL